MPESSTETLKQMEASAMRRTTDISTKIREQLRAALPTAPEQHLTIMVPGKVINPYDFMDGIDEKTGAPITLDTPLRTELKQAILCDDMPTLSNIQMGPTGKSVARSYASALQKLTPAGTPVGIFNAEAADLNQDQKNYIDAMNWLSGEDPDSPGKTRVDSYVEKQRAYTKTVEDKQAAFAKAMKDAQEDPRNTNVKMQREAYDQWVNVHARTYRNHMQAAYMDWVITGKKEAVEYYFAMVDLDTAMARVEQSKECMRAATVMDTDGSAEYQKVKLDPSNWAWHAWMKSQASAQNNLKTVEWYTYEINRLMRTNRVLESAKASEGLFKAAGDADTLPENDVRVSDATKEYMKARKEYEDLSRVKKGADSESDSKKSEALNRLNSTRQAMRDAMADQDRNNLASISKHGQKAQSQKFETLMMEVDKKIQDNQRIIESYETLRKDLMTERAEDAEDLLSKDFDLPNRLPDPTVSEQNTGNKANPSDVWTAISVEIAASSESTQSTESTSSSSVGASFSYGIPVPGLLNISVGANHTQSVQDAQSEMASSNMKISFECMRVDVQRSWLRGELFYDSDLTTNVDISPGPLKLKSWMDPANCASPGKETKDETRERELQRFGTFPMYPVAFILAANVTLEISGDTSKIQSHFSASNTSGSASIGYGPFQLGVSHAQSKKSSSTQCETTASGCRITMKAPQIIGWVSQILPALPRNT